MKFKMIANNERETIKDIDDVESVGTIREIHDESVEIIREIKDDDSVGTIREIKDDQSVGTIKKIKPNKKTNSIPDDDFDEEDETVMERLIGLTEMFPKPVRNFSYNFGTNMIKFIKGLYSFSCTATWIIVSSSAILIAPVVFEVERAQMEEAQRNQQKQVLLGPNTAISHMNPTGMPMPPPVQR